MKTKASDGMKWGEGCIQERTLSDGKVVIQARWVEPRPGRDPVRRGRTFDSRDAAEDHLRDLFRKKRDGRYAAPSDATVAELVAEWLDRGAGRWKPATSSTYRQRAAIHVLPALGRERAGMLTAHRVQRWVDGLVRAGLDASTIDGAHRVLSSALREAVQLGVIPANPAAGVRKPPVRLKEPRTWTLPDIARVVAALAAEPMWSALYRLALTTGMRPGEIRALKWADLDADAGTLTVRRTITKDADGHVVIGSTTKTGKARVLSLPPAVLRSLAAWRAEQTRRRLAAETWHAEGLVFDRGDGRYLPLTSWQHRHDLLTAAAEVPRITFHQMRHTSATLAMEAGEHPLIVSQRLGHRSVQITLDVYTHVSRKTHQTAAAALDDYLFGKDVPPRAAGDDH